MKDRNTNIVRVASYGIDAQSTANGWGRNTSNSSREFITVGNKHRIRQTGSIRRIKIYCASVTGLTSFHLKIWRKDGSTYDLVGTSNDLIGSLVASTVSTCNLATPIDVAEGDYIGYRVVTAVGNSAYHLRALSTDTGTTSYYVNDATPSATDYAWESQTAAASYSCPIEVYMQAPEVVAIGDSIIAGHNAHYSFCEATATSSLASTICKQLETLSGYVYQNMGIGSETTTIIQARFSADVLALKPIVIVINCGVNDIINGVSKATFLAKWTLILAAAQGDSAVDKIVVLKILPWTNGKDYQLAIRDDWNKALDVLSHDYSKAILVDCDSYVGKYRTEGAAGNLWDIQTAYNDDGVHYNSAGHGQIAQAIYNSLSGISAEIDNGSSGATKTINWTRGNLQKCVLNRSCTFTFTAPGGVGDLVLRLTQDLTGSRLVTWPATVKWIAGTAPTLSTVGSKVDIIKLFWNGSVYYGEYSIGFA